MKSSIMRGKTKILLKILSFQFCGRDYPHADAMPDFSTFVKDLHILGLSKGDRLSLDSF